uniref:Uncharacterized protein n=1 Tax=Zea mays TaxID=4577 RepID=A0A804QGD3_MAIZE
MVLDNKVLYETTSASVRTSSPCAASVTFSHLISATMSGVTCCLCFSGQLNSDLRRLAVNLTPFPRLHFFMIWDAKNMICVVDPCHGRYLTASAMFCAKMSSREVDEQMLNCGYRMKQCSFLWNTHVQYTNGPSGCGNFLVHSNSINLQSIPLIQPYSRVVLCTLKPNVCGSRKKKILYVYMCRSSDTI